MCKHKNVQVSMFTSFNHTYFAMCMDCGEELILQPPRLRTTATIGKPNRMARQLKRYAEILGELDG